MAVKKPVFQNAPSSYDNSNEYMNIVDEFLRKNRGSRNLNLYDTGSNTPNILPDTAGINNSMAPDSGMDAQTTDIPNQYNVRSTRGNETAQPDGGQQSSGNGMTYNDFFGQVNATPQLDPNDKQGVFQATGLGFGIASLPDGGTKYNDGTIRYEDGTIRVAQDQYVDYLGNVIPYGGENVPGARKVTIQDNATPIQSLEDGTVKYSDGSIRRPARVDEGYTQENVSPDRYGDFIGAEGMSNFLMGANEPITQGFGEQGDNRFYKTHQAIDYGVANQELNLPVNVRVVSVSRWDGLGAQNTRTPYGNSIVIQLPSGEYMRLSHLSEFGDIQEGQILAAGQKLGTTGTTGNSTGPHLDVELYDQEGNIADPNTFIASVKQAEQKQTNPIQQQSNPYTAEQTQSFPQPVQPITQEPTIMEQAGNLANKTGDILKTGASTVGATTADAIDKWNPTGKQFDLGATELLRGDVPLAGEKLATTIDTANPTGKNFDLGITEALKGDMLGAGQKLGKTINRGRVEAGNIFANLGKKIGAPEMNVSEMASGVMPKVYAAETGSKPLNADYINQQSNSPYRPSAQKAVATTPQRNIFKDIQEGATNIGENVVNAGQDALASAGQGVEGIKNAFGQLMDENLLKNKDLTKMGQKNAIGEESATTSTEAIPGYSKAGPTGNNQDAFFKAGGFDMYKSYMPTDVTKDYRGALNTGLFNDSFYENPDNVANVFGSTSQGKEATDKYRSYMVKQYPIIPGHNSPTVKKVATGKYDDGSEWRVEYEDVDPVYYENQYNKSVIDSIPSVLTSDFKFTAPRTGAKTTAGALAPSGVFTPVKGDKTVPGMTGFQVPSQATNIRAQSVAAPSNVFAAAAKATPYAPASSGYKVPTKSSTPSSSGYKAPSSSSSSQKSSSNAWSAPKQTYQAPKQSSAPKQQSTYNAWSAPKQTYAAPKQQTQSKPASQSQNVFTNLVNTIKSWFK